MIFQTVFYLSARLFSVFLSFFLFAWVGRVLLPEDAAKAFFCIFILGFCLATARMSSQVGAAVSADSRRAERCRDVHRGHQVLLYLLIPICLFGSVSIWIHTRSMALAWMAGMTILAASPNLDLVRGMLDKSSIFSASFAAGTLLSLVLIQWVLPASLNGVVFGLLCQWFFVALVNLRVFRRVFRRSKRSTPSGALFFFSSLLACFDGVVLNAPFFGFLAPSSKLAEVLSLTIRVFVASLPILPLLIHWTNSKIFHEFCQVRGFPIKLTFKVVMFFSGLGCGLIFLFVYMYIAKKDFAAEILCYYLMLLFAYSFFVPELRFSSKSKPSYLLPFTLSLLLLVYAILMLVSLTLLRSEGWVVVSLQVGALMLAALILRRSGRSCTSALT